VLLVAIAGAYFFISRQPIIKQSEIKDVSFPIYSPTKEPKGYELDRSATQLSKDTFSYTFVSDSDDDDIVVTLQPVPSGFDMTKLVGSGTVTTRSTDLGILYDLSTPSKTQYLLKTEETLIFFTSQDDVSVEQVVSLVDSLVKL
jgi:hypothetical protein